MFWRTFKIMLLIFVFVGITSISAYLSMTFFIKSEDVVVVPDLKGKEIVTALKTLSDSELNTKVRQFEYHAKIPVNHIIFQDPPAGHEIKKGRDVRLILSKGPQSIVMPNLVGMSGQQAKIIIEVNDMRIGIETRTSHPHVQAGSVIAQYPLPNTTIMKESKINLLVSTGMPAQAYLVPHLQSLSLPTAASIIEAHGFTLGKIHTLYDSKYPANVVIKQEPNPGERFAFKSIVNLYVNRKDMAQSDLFDDDLQETGFFRYRIAPGYLNHRIQVVLTDFLGEEYLIDAFYPPGKVVWGLIPRYRTITLLLYDDNRLVKSQMFN